MGANFLVFNNIQTQLDIIIELIVDDIFIVHRKMLLKQIRVVKRGKDTDNY